jgi:hypothetical protein
MTTRILALVVAVACSFGGTAASTTNLKPFDPAALRDTVEATAKELMVPGAMVLLRTPQGEFVFGYGTTELGGTTLPRPATHFRIASNTKTMTAAVIVLLVQEGKLRFDESILSLRHPPVGRFWIVGATEGLAGLPPGGLRPLRMTNSYSASISCWITGVSPATGRPPNFLPIAHRPNRSVEYCQN